MFSSGDAFYQHKNAMPVRVEVAAADTINGFVFLAVGDRLSDLLNDARPFIPVRRSDGEIVIIAKLHIVSMVEREASQKELDAAGAKPGPLPPANDDPYGMLQVAQDAPMADIISACRRQTEKLLPRNMVGVNVDDPQIKSALSAAKKILNAYKMILRERGLDRPAAAVRDETPPTDKSSARQRSAP